MVFMVFCIKVIYMVIKVCFLGVGICMLIRIYLSWRVFFCWCLISLKVSRVFFGRMVGVCFVEKVLGNKWVLLRWNFFKVICERGVYWLERFGVGGLFVD